MNKDIKELNKSLQTSECEVDQLIEELIERTTFSCSCYGAGGPAFDDSKIVP